MINHGLFASADVKAAKDDGSLLTSIMRVIEGNPDLKKALDEEERLVTQADRRSTIIADVQALRAAAERNIEQLIADEAAARKELQLIEPRYEAVAAAWKRADNALGIAKYQAKVDEARLLDELEKNAAPIIDETHRKLTEMWLDYFQDRKKYAPTVTAEPVGKRRRPKGTSVWTNSPSIEKWKSAVLAGLDDLAAMKRDLDQTNIDERCKAILESLPDWKEVVEVEI